MIQLLLTLFLCGSARAGFLHRSVARGRVGPRRPAQRPAGRGALRACRNRRIIRNDRRPPANACAGRGRVDPTDGLVQNHVETTREQLAGVLRHARRRPGQNSPGRTTPQGSTASRPWPGPIRAATSSEPELHLGSVSQGRSTRGLGRDHDSRCAHLTGAPRTISRRSKLDQRSATRPSAASSRRHSGRDGVMEPVGPRARGGDCQGETPRTTCSSRPRCSTGGNWFRKVLVTQAEATVAQPVRSAHRGAGTASGAQDQR